VSTPLLSRSPDRTQAVEEPPKPKPIDDGPPEPYTVFEPDPTRQEAVVEEPPASLPRPAEPRPNLPINLPKAADSPNLNLPSPPLAPVPQQQQPPVDNAPQKPAQTGHAFVDMGNKTLDDIEKKVDSHHQNENGKSKLPEQFVRTLDDTTLAGIEEKVDSPHAKASQADKPKIEEERIDYHKEAANQVVRAMSGTTLDKIEEKVDSPHAHEEAAVVPPAAAKKDDGLQLSYEPHESEPAEKTEKVEKPTAADETTREEITPPDKKLETEKPEKTSPKAPEPAPAQAETKKPEEPKEPKPAEAKPAPQVKQPDPEVDKARQEEARDAVMRAISVGGDGRTALPPLEGIGTAGAVEVNHEASTKDQKQPTPPSTPPPIQPTPHHGPSPNISIDPVDGTLVPLPPNLVPNSEGLPPDETASAANEASAPPEVPPPMMPPVQKVGL